MFFLEVKFNLGLILSLKQTNKRGYNIVANGWTCAFKPIPHSHTSTQFRNQSTLSHSKCASSHFSSRPSCTHRPMDQQTNQYTDPWMDKPLTESVTLTWYEEKRENIQNIVKCVLNWSDICDLRCKWEVKRTRPENCYPSRVWVGRGRNEKADQM